MRGRQIKPVCHTLGHVMRVMQSGKTIDEKIVGVLHDIVEDTTWTFDALLAEGFPAHIVDALRCVRNSTT